MHRVQLFASILLFTINISISRPTRQSSLLNQQIDPNGFSITNLGRIERRLRGGGIESKRLKTDIQHFPRIFVLGGNPSLEMFTNVVESYDISENCWRKECRLPHMVAGCSAVSGPSTR